MFRTAYYIANMNRPFTVHDDLIGLQENNGVDLATSLHSRYSCTKIAENVAEEIQTIVNSIVSSSSKLAVLFNEATSASHKSAMIVSVKALVDGATPEFVFLELLELESQTTESIEKALLTCLDTAGLSEEWLQKNWIAFVSDGASVMLGRNPGVATRLTARYPHPVTGMNHRLELAVSQAIDKVISVNHFKAFMEKIHNLCNQSGKNSRELLEAAQEVGSHVQQINRVLNTRWVASSSYGALKNILKMLLDHRRNAKERHTYKGLANRLQSTFLSDRGLMYDALSDLSNLSQQLQLHSITL